MFPATADALDSIPQVMGMIALLSVARALRGAFGDSSNSMPMENRQRSSSRSSERHVRFAL